MSYELQTPLTRITWRDGQRLTARDLNDAEGRVYRLRRFHHLYMHGAASGNWGIITGYDVAIVASGDSIAVTQGYAIDSSGRDLILSHNVVVPVPPVTGLLILVIRYQPDKNRCAPPQQGGCEKSPLGPQWEFPAFVWLSGDEFNPNSDIALAAMRVVIGIAQTPVIDTMRRKMRPISSNKIGYGVTTSFETKWNAATGQLAGTWFETTVDTSSWGFVRTPLYFADLVWSHQLVASEASGGAFIVDARPESFTLRLLTGFETAGLPANAQKANDDGWTVSWLGFEPAPTGPASKLTFLHLSGFDLGLIKLKV
jgi:hypothetical protein